jgi:hypothetical protein
MTKYINVAAQSVAHAEVDKALAEAVAQIRAQQAQQQSRVQAKPTMTV